MEKRITIAIDGFSSTGKSTIAKQLARELGYIYVDTGAMYRAVTLYAMQNKIINKEKFDSSKLIQQLDKITLTFKFNEKLGFGEIYLNQKNVEKEIRSLEVSKYVSQVSTLSEVRKKLVVQQKDIGKNTGVVMDGRDIGTVVLKNADLKLYMTASSKKRALRRYKELTERGDDVTYEDILKNVEYRDFIDSTREDSPLVKADDAIEFDNSNMNLEEQFERILNYAKQLIKKKN